MASRTARRMLSGLAILLLTGAAVSPEPSEPSHVVERLQVALLEAMKDAEALGYEGRYGLLAPVLDASFDFSFMARIALGRTWKQLDEPQHERWVKTFRELSLATYAGRFNGFSGEGFETDGQEPAPNDTVLVKTRLVRPGKEAVALHYRMRQRDGDWRIIDIYMNGTVSELALRRSEYSAVLEREGFDFLVTALQEKIAVYAEGKDADPST